jgi:hypothetical protein
MIYLLPIIYLILNISKYPLRVSPYVLVWRAKPVYICLLGFDANHTSDLSDALDDFLNKHKLLQVRWWVLLLLMREGTLNPNFLGTCCKRWG